MTPVKVLPLPERFAGSDPVLEDALIEGLSGSLLRQIS